MKIAVIGTHGTGKSTLSYFLASYYKMQGKNVKIVQEVARSCPFPINDGLTKESVLWIYHEHSRKELEASKLFDVAICDRSSFDSFVYAKHFNIFDEGMQSSFIEAKKNLMTGYDHVIFVRPDMPLHADGVRSTNQYFQDSVDHIFSENLIGVRYHEIKSSNIFREGIDVWKQCFC